MPGGSEARKSLGYASFRSGYRSASHTNLSGESMKKHDEMLASLATLATSVAPTAAAHVRLRPIDSHGVVIRDGLLADRQRVNREVTILRGAEELETAGTLDNFRIAAGRASGTRRGMVFSDTDATSGSRRSRGRSGVSRRASSSALRARRPSWSPPHRRRTDTWTPGARSSIRPGGGPTSRWATSSTARVTCSRRALRSRDPPATRPSSRSPVASRT